MCAVAGPKGTDSEVKLVVAGLLEGVEAACAAIEAIIAENYTVAVPIESSDVVSFLVGAKGEAIKKFQVWEARWRLCVCQCRVRAPLWQFASMRRLR
jgi:hypothetical protein